MKASAMNGTAPARRKRRPGSRPGGPSMGRSDRRILFRMIPPLPGYTQFVMLQSSCSGYCDQPEPLPASPYRIWARKLSSCSCTKVYSRYFGLFTESSGKPYERGSRSAERARGFPITPDRSDSPPVRPQAHSLISEVSWLNVKNLSLQKNGDYRLNRPSSVS